MYRLIVENMKGEQLNFTADTDLEIINIDGLTPSPAIISSAVVGNFDGERFSSSRVDKRNIVITAHLCHNPEECRLRLYKYFQPKRKCRLYFTTDSRDVYIDGYVEAFDGNLFEQGQKMQISVICTQPYFLLAENMSGRITRTTDLFEFPFSIDKNGIPFSEVNYDSSAVVVNNGDVETGIIIQIVANGRVVNPSIYNTDTQESFEIADVIMDVGAVIEINTNQGNKSVTIIREGIRTNIMSKLAEHVDWFQLEPGASQFVLRCDRGAENAVVEFFVSEKYQGV